MNRKNLLITACMGAALVACSQLPKEAYYNHGQPESLVEDSSEVINLKLTSPASIEEVTNWLNKDQPTRAELKCSKVDGVCGEAKSVLRQFGVPVKYTEASDNTVALIYERIQARDCENRYIDNMINPYNLNYITFGCSMAVNMAQMVTDKRAFTNPPIMDDASGVQAAQAYSFANLPPSYTQPKSNSDFSAIATEQSLQTSGLTGGNSR